MRLIIWPVVLSIFTLTLLMFSAGCADNSAGNKTPADTNAASRTKAGENTAANSPAQQAPAGTPFLEKTREQAEKSGTNSAANFTNQSAGATPTPGIPDVSKGAFTVKPGATPTPGIPDAETIRRQFNRRFTNSNVNEPTLQKPQTGENSRKNKVPIGKAPVGNQ